MQPIARTTSAAGSQQGEGSPGGFSAPWADPVHVLLVIRDGKILQRKEDMDVMHVQEVLLGAV